MNNPGISRSTKAIAANIRFRSAECTRLNITGHAIPVTTPPTTNQTFFKIKPVTAVAKPISMAIAKAMHVGSIKENATAKAVAKIP